MAAQRYDHILMCEGLTQRESDALPAIFVKVDLARVPSLGALAILLDLVGQAISPLALELRCAPAFGHAGSVEAVRASRKTAKRGREPTGMRANGGVGVVVHGAEVAEIRLALLLTRPSIVGCVARAPLVTMG